MRRNWALSASHLKKEGKVTLYDYSWKNYLKLALEDAIFTFDAEVADHWLCGSGLPDIFWKIPVGKPVYDDDWKNEDGSPMLDNSVGALVYNLSSRFMTWAGDSIEEDKVFEMTLTPEQVIALDPEMAYVFEDDDEDE